MTVTYMTKIALLFGHALCSLLFETCFSHLWQSRRSTKNGKTVLESAHHAVPRCDPTQQRGSVRQRAQEHQVSTPRRRASILHLCVLKLGVGEFAAGVAHSSISTRVDRQRLRFGFQVRSLVILRVTKANIVGDILS